LSNPTTIIYCRTASTNQPGKAIEWLINSIAAVIEAALALDPGKPKVK
jgi:hypothetical protein